MTALTFGCVSPPPPPTPCASFLRWCFLLQGVLTKAAHVRREISLNRYYRGKKKQQNDKKKPLLKSIYVIFIDFSFAIIRHKIILRNNHSEIKTSILPFHQFHVSTKLSPYGIMWQKPSKMHFGGEVWSCLAASCWWRNAGRPRSLSKRGPPDVTVSLVHYFCPFLKKKVNLLFFSFF